MKYLRLLPVFFLLLDACVEPLKIDLGVTNPKLVVDGLVTNEQGPYQVMLFYSTNLENTVRKPVVESGAMVWIVSDANESESLIETTPGLYQTGSTEFKGRIGASYKVKIITSKGKAYESSYQKLYPGGVIDSLFVSFKSQSIANNIDDELKDAIAVLVNASGSPGTSNSFRWRWKSVYKARSFPELRTENVGAIRVPDPEPCSGYVRNGLTISKRSECTCCICWSTLYGSRVVLSNADYIKNNEFNNLNIGELSVNSMLFYDRLYLEVEQLSLTEAAYDFWKLVDIQQQSSENLFQPNAVKVRGNISCISDPKEEVLGFFSASSIARKSIFVNNTIVPYILSPIDTIPHDCRDSFLNAATEKPFFW